MTRKALHFCDLLFPNPQSQPERENMIHTQTEGHSIKHMTSTPQNSRGLKKQGKSEKLLRPEETNEAQ